MNRIRPTRRPVVLSSRFVGSEMLEPRRLFAIVVNTTADTISAGSTSLRSAILQANEATSATTITFDPGVFTAGKTITLSGTQLQLTNTAHATTITGPAAGVTISGNKLSRVFDVSANVTASFVGLTITKGIASGNGIDADGGAIRNNGGILTVSNCTFTSDTAGGGTITAGVGGAIYNGKTATITGCTFTGNVAGGGGGAIATGSGFTATVSACTFNSNTTNGQGGAIINSGTLTLSGSTFTGNSGGTNYQGGGLASTFGLNTVTDCTFSGNKAAGGGAIYFNYGTNTLKNVTVSGNTVTDLGGGIYVSNGDNTFTNVTVANNTATNDGGGIYTIATGRVTTLALNNVTVAGNSSDTVGGVLANPNVTVTYANTVVAGNSDSEGAPDVYGTITSKGNNLIGKTDSSTGWGLKDNTGTIASPLSAKLGSLADNGGPTKTLLPQTGSPLIDKGSNSLIPSGVTTDQRDLARISGTAVDIGAVEVQSAVATAKITVTAAASQTATASVAKSFTLGSFTASNTTSPYTVTVDWGDGSTKTTFTQTAAGTITAQSHTYAKSGSDTISVTVTDAKSNKSNTATTAVTVSAVVSNTASIAGTVFSDTDGDGVKDTGEAGISGVVLYNDANNNSVKDTGEATATTDSTGAYKFSGLAAGTYKIRQVLPSGYTQTSPSGGAGQGVTVTAGQVITGKNFGDKPGDPKTASIAGTVFNDADADKTFDAAELGLGGYQVFLDTNKNGTLDSGETVATTDPDGLFSFTGLAAGTYTVRVLQRTKTAATTSNPLTITLTSGKASAANLFGEKRITTTK